MTALVKLGSSHGLPLVELAWFRNLFAFLPIFAYVAWLRDPAVLRTTRPRAHLLRGALGLLTVLFTFAAVSHLPLNESTTLGFSMPLFATLLSALVLRERVGGVRWLATLVGFVGVLLVVRPDPARLHLLGAVYGLTAALCSGAAMVTIRKIAATEPGVRITFYTTLLSTVAIGAALPWHWVTPSPRQLLGLAAIGVCGGATQLLQSISLQFAPVSSLVPFDYTQLLWSGALAWIAFGELPQRHAFIGAALIAGAGVFLAQVRPNATTKQPLQDRPR